MDKGRCKKEGEESRSMFACWGESKPSKRRRKRGAGLSPAGGARPLSCVHGRHVTKDYHPPPPTSPCPLPHPTSNHEPQCQNDPIL
jgi:hypothetical protein